MNFIDIRAIAVACCRGAACCAVEVRAEFSAGYYKSGHQKRGRISHPGNPQFRVSGDHWKLLPDVVGAISMVHCAR